VDVLCHTADQYGPTASMIGVSPGHRSAADLHPSHARALPARPPLSARGAAAVRTAPPDQTVCKPRRFSIGAKSRSLCNNV
jgi:hypothetical protein